MTDDIERRRGETAIWLGAQFAAQIASALETMAGERPTMDCQQRHEQPTTPGLMWRQSFDGIDGAASAPSSTSLYATIHATETAWSGLGDLILKAAGIDDGDTATIQSTYLETLSQAIAGVAQVLSARLGREVTPAGGEQSSVAREPAVLGGTGVPWTRIAIQLAGLPTAGAILEIGFTTTLLDLLAPALAPPVPRALPGAAGEPSGPDGSRTFDLLLDVELPVSVSFGRAQIQLKDALKLTTGSIVELNRSIVEPVEIIVNNCVIARGEVVVVEGNFGVRIQQVISRQERLRTLN